MDISDIPPATRSEISISNTVKFYWSATDVVGMFPDRGAQAYFEMENFAGGDAAEFNGGGWALKTASQYSVYFPYDYGHRDRSCIPFDFRGQIQHGKSNYSHLSAYQFMAAGASSPVGGECAYSMERIEAVVIFKLKLPVIARYNQLNIRVADGTPCVSTVNLDISQSVYIILSDVTTNRFVLDLEDVETTTENEEVYFYTMMPPQNYYGKKIIVSVNTADGDCCQAEIDGKNMLNNHAYQYVATLTSDMGSLVESFGSESGNW